MDSRVMTGSRSFLRPAASLWFAAVLLVLILVAMACATVFESTNGTEQALALFYRTWWFDTLLALLAVNVAAALVVRYPFSKRQIGFVTTHTAVLITLAGAVVTKHYGVDGQVGIFEGETVGSFTIPDPTLTLLNRTTRDRSTVDLDASTFAGFEAWSGSESPILTLDDIAVEIMRYLPDSAVSERMVDDDPHGRPAVEMSLSASGRDDPVWVFADQTATIGPLTATFRVFQTDEALAHLLAGEPGASDESGAIVKIEHEGSTYEIPMEDCTDKAVPIGDTGYTVHVLRYLPHAMVGSDRKVTNASDRPMNPAIEVELIGPKGPEKRLAFARFPDFKSMHGAAGPKVHGRSETEGLKLTFVTATNATPTAPIEVLKGPDGSIHVRFRGADSEIVTRKLDVGTAVETPWPDMKFSVLRRFDRARTSQNVAPVEPIREDRVPAVLVKVTTAARTSGTWVQKYRSRPMTIDGTPYELAFGNKEISLGFQITLNRFRIGYYPGERKPRSFESSISIIDTASGRRQDRVVSMNHPTSYGGYTLYQSSYRQGRERTASFLSVSRDPGKAIVFAGYISIMIGMVIILITRMLEHRRMKQKSAAGGVGIGDRSYELDQPGSFERCVQGARSVDCQAGRPSDQPVSTPR